MLAGELDHRRLARGFGLYNAVATAAGSLGALAAAGIGPLRRVWSSAPSEPRFFLVLVPAALAGIVLARTLSPAVERQTPLPRLCRDRCSVRLDQSCSAWRDCSHGLLRWRFRGPGVHCLLAGRAVRRLGWRLGVTFFVIGLLQTASLLAAGPLAERFGLLATMVFTHLPSNVLLVAVAFAPNLTIAVALLLAR